MLSGAVTLAVVLFLLVFTPMSLAMRNSSYAEGGQVRAFVFVFILWAIGGILLNMLY